MKLFLFLTVRFSKKCNYVGKVRERERKRISLECFFLSVMKI